MQENMAYLSNLDQPEMLSQKLKARTMRAEAPTQSIAATSQCNASNPADFISKLNQTSTDL
ncbi:Uncharacterized protein QJS10_CPB14g00194 [Acorus calamus]|uniref:Uncharacterized protein n=1 Tax=Acorus calamus TaxID=4465 RepID=A0AAV9DCT0_ACOCL|nr:Uncharacterized protein QJS10_CPB14g00194 [Acorus calamus]